MSEQNSRHSEDYGAGLHEERRQRAADTLEAQAEVLAREIERELLDINETLTFDLFAVSVRLETALRRVQAETWEHAAQYLKELGDKGTILRDAAVVLDDAQCVLDTFRQAEAQGYRSRERQYVIDILGRHFPLQEPTP